MDNGGKISEWVCVAIAAVCIAASVAIWWVLSGQPPGDHYDQEASLFLEILPAVIGMCILVIGVNL